MDYDIKFLKVYFYAKLTSRKTDGKYPVMGRLVYNGQRVQFSTSVYISENELPYIGNQSLGRKKTKNIRELIAISDLMKMFFVEMKYAYKDINLHQIILEYRNYRLKNGI